MRPDLKTNVFQICPTTTPGKYSILRIHKEAYFDTDKMEKIVCENHERYNFDAYLDLGTRNHFPQMQALGGGSYVLNEQTGSINVTDAPTLEPEEYEAFAKNPIGYFNILFSRKFPDLTTQSFVNAAMAFLKSSGYAREIQKKFAETYNRPTMISTSAVVQPAFEVFHSSLRGIAGVSTDMRRYPKQLKEACDSYWQAVCLPSLQRALQATEKPYVADVYCGLIAHQVMNRKQFEQLYLPQLRQIIDACAAAGKIVYLYVEGSIARFAEYFKDVPKGCAIMHLEMDDIFEMRRLLPDMCLAGGMTTDLLGRASAERCVEQAKKLVSELGPGYIMSQNKMLSFKNDCRRENLLAVNSFVREYQL